MSIINTEYSQRMIAVADLIEVRDRFDYSCWIGTVYDDEQMEIDAPVTLNTNCELVGCIGGWAVTWAICEGLIDAETANRRSTSDAAARVLGLTSVEADALFLGYAMVKLGWYPSCDAALGHATATEAAKLLRGVAVGEYDLDDLTQDYHL